MEAKPLTTSPEELVAGAKAPLDRALERLSLVPEISEDKTIRDLLIMHPQQSETICDLFLYFPLTLFSRRDIEVMLNLEPAKSISVMSLFNALIEIDYDNYYDVIVKMEYRNVLACVNTIGILMKHNLFDKGNIDFLEIENIDRMSILNTCLFYIDYSCRKISKDNTPKMLIPQITFFDIATSDNELLLVVTRAFERLDKANLITEDNLNSIFKLHFFTKTMRAICYARNLHQVTLDALILQDELNQISLLTDIALRPRFFQTGKPSPSSQGDIPTEMVELIKSF